MMHSEIQRLRQLVSFREFRSALAASMTAAQQAKMDEIEALLVEVGEPTLDEELDAMIVELTEIRDRE